MLFSAACQAQSVTPEDEYKQLIKVNQDIQALGPHPFGENINLYDGTLSFEETDVSLPGNGPTIRFSRSLGTTNALDYGFNAERPLGDWDLDIPRIETAAANQGGVTGWEVSGASPLQRCSDFGAPPYVPGGTITSADTWGPNQWWYGYHLILPGQGSQTLLGRSSNPLSPTISGESFPIVTKQNWMIGCGVTASDGGEGFLAIAPDGTRYTFAHLFYRPMTYITKPGGMGPDVVAAAGGTNLHPLVAPSTTDILARRDALMYVTQIQDRFGSTLTYNYDSATGYLASIIASDGREVDVTYVPGSPLIKSVIAKATDVPSRTWIYSYDTSNSLLPTLTSVTLPDGSAWSYHLGAFQTNPINVAFSNCYLNDAGTVTSNPATGTVTAPSGLTGTFAETPLLHGRSYVPKSCWGGLNPTEDVYFNIPNTYYQQSVTSEAITGAGLAAAEWSYSYSPANESWSSDACATSGTCATSVYTDVTDPSGNATRYTFSNRFDVTEGQLLRTDFHNGVTSSAVVRSEFNSYGNPTGGPWPAAYGIDLQGRDNRTQTEEVSPLIERQIIQDGGQIYTWRALAFDAYAQPTDVKRYNSIVGQPSIEETTSYLNDTHLWVLGLPLTVTNDGNGEVESANTYAANDTPLTRSRFGELLMSYTFNGAGQLASFEDGDSNITKLCNYKRGIPQTINYPDGTSESLVVDDLGQISSITDPAGHTTQYSYYAGGRIHTITYPYDGSIDSAQWYTKSFAYTTPADTGAERGLAAGHLRRTVTQGNYTDTTYFDAELRPVLDDSSTGAANSDITTVTSYDWAGRNAFASYPVSGSPSIGGRTSGMHSSYDALGRLTQTQQDSELGPLTTTTAYLPGPGTRVTDPKGNITTTYDQAFDIPSYSSPVQVNAPQGVTQNITRNVYDEPTQITQSGTYNGQNISRSKALYYDSYYRLCRAVEPETGSTVLAYDGANNLAWSADGLNFSGIGCDQAQVPAAAQTVRSYYPMNRLHTITPPAGTQSSLYKYDALGHVLSVVSGAAIQGYAYNSLGMMTNEVLTLPGQNPMALDYAYDAYGHLTAIGYPAGSGGSEVVAYAPNPRGWTTEVGSYATGIGYYPNGQVENFAYGNGTSYSADQNTRQLTSNFSDGTGGTLSLSEDLSYDADGNITSVNDLIAGRLRSKSFGYDGLNRLTSAQATYLYGAESYTYDPLNNLRTRLTNGQTDTYNYDVTNRLATITAGASVVNSFAYDPRGNETTRNGATLVFDAKDQLTQYVNNDSYSYDAEGRRVEKLPAGSSTPTYYLYNHAGQLMYRYAPATAIATNFIYLGTKLIARHDSTQLAQPGAISFDANPSNGNVTVNWGAVPEASSYNLEVRANGGAWTSIYAGSATQTTQSGLAGGGYVYQVQACAPGNCSSWTLSATLGVGPALPTITVPTGTINGSYQVSWTAPAGATGYTVQERLNGGAWATIANNTPATSISRPGTTSGSYTYQVSASNAYGSRGWVASSAVTVNTAYGVVPTPLPTYSVPSTNTTGSVTVSWSASTPVTGYTLQQSSNGGSSWSTVYSGSGTSVALSGLANGSYTYRLQACNNTAGNAACTAWVAAGPMAVTLSPTSAPSLSVPASSGNGSFTVSWSAVGNATSYTLQQSSNGGNWSTVQSSSARSWSASGHSNGSYGYRVQACAAGGCGPWSGTGTISVLLPPGSAPGLTVPTSSNTGNYTVSWGAVATASSYILRESVNSGGWSTLQSSSAVSRAISGHGTGSYAYQVQACNSGGCGPWSSTKTISVLRIPAMPSGIEFPSTGYYPSKWTVMWSAVSGATSYTLQRTNTGTGGLVVTVYTGAGTSVIETNVTPGTYQYALKACNAAGCSAWQIPTLKMTVSCIGGAAVKAANGVQPHLLKCGGTSAPLSTGSTP